MGKYGDGGDGILEVWDTVELFETQQSQKSK